MLRCDCHLPFLGRFAFRFRFPIPLPTSFCFVPRSPFSGSLTSLQWSLPTPGLLISQYTSSSGSLVGNSMALSSSRTTPLDTCPVLRPRWCPVCSPFLFASRTAAFQRVKTVGFHTLTSQCAYLSSTTIPFSGLNSAACILAPSSSVLPLPGLHVDFATDLLARLWSGGTFTHWVILTNFLEGSSPF